MSMRRQLASAAVAITLFVAACSPDATQPTAPPSQPEAPPMAGAPAVTCPTAAQIRALIVQLYGPNSLAETRFNLIVVTLPTKPLIGKLLTFQLVGMTIKAYRQGQLIGGTSPQTKTAAITLINGLFCYAKIKIQLPGGALDPGSGIGIVDPGSPETTILNGNQTAGVLVPANSVTEPTLITITPLGAGSNPLNTQLDQYPQFNEVSFQQAGNTGFTQDVTVGLCPVDNPTYPNPIPADPNSTILRVAHNVGSSIEILPFVPAGFVNCTAASSAATMIGAAASTGRLGDLARALVRAAGTGALDLVAPKLYAFAGGAGVGGKTKSFSPFGTVDIRVNASAASPTSISGMAGGSASQSDLPSVAVATPQGRSVSGLSVTFSVPAGSEGSVTGGSTTTDQAGKATVGGWNFGLTPGQDLVNADVSPPHVGSTVVGSPVGFAATIFSPIPVPFGSSGYRYLGGEGAPPFPPVGFETLGFDDSSWLTGSAPFGSPAKYNDAQPPVLTGCAINQGTVTLWPVNSQILLRKTFAVPGNWAGQLSIRVAIDNDVQVFVNGTDVTASAGLPIDSQGFVRHEGCAEPAYVFTAPNSALVLGGTNLIAVRARDRGVESYVDLQATLVP